MQIIKNSIVLNVDIIWGKNTCLYCGKKYYGTYGRKFCSTECIDNYWKITIKCKICDKEFIGRKGIKYCSKKYSKKRKSKLYKIDNNII